MISKLLQRSLILFRALSFFGGALVVFVVMTTDESFALTTGIVFPVIATSKINNKKNNVDGSFGLC